MNIQTFSVVSGTKACDAKCPFCISRMTGFDNTDLSHPINKRNLKKAILMAERHSAQSILITGKGEPTLYPHQISEYLTLFRELGCSVPVIELQTNGILIGKLANGERSLVTESILEYWYNNGLDIIALSVVDVDGDGNKKVYTEDYPDLEKTIKFIRSFGFQVRICVMMQKGLIDGIGQFDKCVKFCKKNDVFQLTIRTIKKTDKKAEDVVSSEYVAKYGLDLCDVRSIREYIQSTGTLLKKLVHGAEVYDYYGQNVCISDCLTVEPTNSDIRTLIFYPSGEISYDWQYSGARFL